MTDEQRQQAVLFYEGQVLTTAGHNGVGQAADAARCIIDGTMNALVRLQGANVTSQFAFAVADRIVAAVREPTPWPPAAQQKPSPPSDKIAALLDALAAAAKDEDLHAIGAMLLGVLEKETGIKNEAGATKEASQS